MKGKQENLAINKKNGYKFLIADDHEIIRSGLQQILSSAFPTAYIEMVNDAEGVIRKTVSEKWSVVISDLSMPGRSGLEVAEYIKKNFPETPVLILSIYPEDHYAIRALRAGASGYLNKNIATDELVNAVTRVLQGRKYISPEIAENLLQNLDGETIKAPHEQLSNRELHVFKMIAVGQSVSEIAEHLSLSINTVSTYKARILKKMNLKTVADLTIYAIENHFIL
ncbi:MAG TPA: response regulator transcription factor [Mucilaginibacter sp.]|nr:response regulator transcription factor [Mucilaginibacter sp.]